MTQDNIERAKRLLEAVGRVDYEAAMELVHPQIELVPPGAQAPRKGAGRFRQWLEPDAFAEQVIQPLDFVAGEEGRVLSKQHIKARGSGSGIELEIESFTVWSFDEDGLITRVEIFLPHEEARARAAAGLSD
jgi:ketosteroid isomerase-like protein